jgi:hypothetical protein
MSERIATYINLTLAICEFFHAQRRLHPGVEQRPQLVGKPRLRWTDTSAQRFCRESTGAGRQAWIGDSPSGWSGININYGIKINPTGFFCRFFAAALA